MNDKDQTQIPPDGGGWKQDWEVGGGVASVVGLVVPLFPDVPLWLRIALSIICPAILLTILWRRRKWIRRAAERLHQTLSGATPWVAFTSMLLTLLILFNVWQSHGNTPIRPIDFGRTQGAIFNSFDHAPTHTRFVQAFGENKKSLAWKLEDDKTTSAFAFETDPKIKPSGFESVGGYFVFYDNPFDRLRFHVISLEARATDFTGQPDVGLRIAVDNPQAAGDRELVSYEYPSLSSRHLLDSTWHRFKIPLSDFKEVLRRPPFPDGLDANKINKLVFFVNVGVATNCPKGTLYFRDISFQR